MKTDITHPSVYIKKMSILSIVGFVCILSWFGYSVFTIEPKMENYLFFFSLLAFPFIIIAVKRVKPFWHSRIKDLFIILIITEFFLQILGITGLIPGLNVINRIPYGRIYWTNEGFSNSVMNRNGWYYPELRLDNNTRKIAIIGDSFVEAMQIDRNQNVGKLLEEKLNILHHGGHEVLAFGISGTGFAQYYELMKHAIQFYKIKDAIIVIYCGNDFINLSPALNSIPADRYIYYDAEAKDNLKLLKDGDKAVKRFNSSFESNRKSLFFTLPLIIKSHLMLFSIFKSVIFHIQNYFQNKSMREQDTSAENNLHYIFEKKPGKTAEKYLQLGLKMIDSFKKLADSNDVKLKIVTLPIIPPEFYHSNSLIVNSFKNETHDFLIPDQAIQNFCIKKNIPCFSFAQHLIETMKHKIDVKTLFLREGHGHFSVNGHACFAEFLFLNF